jgi:hypothetical protein
LYSPPGCTSKPAPSPGASAQGCYTSGSVNYTAAGSSSTKISFQTSLKDEESAGVDFGLSIGDFLKFGFSYSSSQIYTSTTGSAQTISVGTQLKLSASGIQDGVDHTQDQFYLIANPAVVIERKFERVNTNIGYRDNNPAHAPLVLNVTVAELQKWISQPEADPNDTNRFPFNAFGFTVADFKAILNLDPFAVGDQLDPTRYLPTTYSFEYRAPDPSSCIGGRCFCDPPTVSLTNSLQTETSSSFAYTNSNSFTVSLSGSVGDKNKAMDTLGFKTGDSFGVTTTSSQSDVQSNSVSAEYTLACPSPGTPPKQMAVYSDRMFNTFAFVPYDITPQNNGLAVEPGNPLGDLVKNTTLVHSGRLLYVSGKPAAYQQVEIQYLGRSFHTTTDALGNYSFYGPISPKAETGMLKVVGFPAQSLSIGSGKRVEVTLKAPHQ